MHRLLDLERTRSHNLETNIRQIRAEMSQVPPKYSALVQTLPTSSRSIQPPSELECIHTYHPGVFGDNIRQARAEMSQ
eukprot:2495282-Rhodomonas_salina.1